MSDPTIKYELHVHCRRGGVTRDAGVHATYDTKEEADRLAPIEIRWLKTYYDEVNWQIVQVGEDE